MESIWWLSLFLSTSILFHHTHQYTYTESYCRDEVPGYIVHVWEIDSEFMSGYPPKRQITATTLGTAVIVSDRWVLTSSRTGLTDLNIEDSFVQFGTSSLTTPTPLNSRYILSKVPFKELALIEVNETFPFDTSESSVKAAKLPPNIEFASKCKKPALNGWTQTYWLGGYKYTANLYCYHGSRRSTCWSREKEITFPYDKCTFCFDGLFADDLRAHKGNAVLCNNDVLIGITYYATLHNSRRDIKNIVEVGHYMTWIGKTTGIEVAYQSEPKTTTEKEEPITRQPRRRRTTQRTWKSTSPLSRSKTTDNDDDESNAPLSTMNNFLIIVSLILSLYRLIAY